MDLICFNSLGSWFHSWLALNSISLRIKTATLLSTLTKFLSYDQSYKIFLQVLLRAFIT